MSLVLAALTGALLSAGGPTFIDDDYPRALALAKRQHKVLFVDVWAPWCPSCLVMRAEVLSQSELRAFEDQLVFASIDTERARNAPFLRRFPIEVWPTLLFIDPRREEVLLRWAGSADLQQFRALILASRQPSEGDALLVQGKLEAAAAAYLRSLGRLEAVDGGVERGGADGGARTFDAGDATLDGGGVDDAHEEGPEGSAEAARAASTAVLTLLLSRQLEPCVRAAEAAWTYVTRPKDRANLASLALSCAVELEREREPKGSEVAQSRAHFAMRARELLDAKEALEADGALPDVVSGLFEVAVQERSSAGDAGGARALATAWLASLDEHALRASSAVARTALDGHRVAAALAAGVPERALAALERSERDFPRDYNPPARLARLYQELGRLDEALAAIDRALARCGEGPRRLRLFQLKVSVLSARGDDASARATLARADAWAKKLPPSKHLERWTRWMLEERARLAERAARPGADKAK